MEGGFGPSTVDDDGRRWDGVGVVISCGDGDGNDAVLRLNLSNLVVAGPSSAKPATSPASLVPYLMVKARTLGSLAGRPASHTQPTRAFGAGRE